MNILFLSQHCCIRVIKEGIGLMKAGHNVHYLQERIANPELLPVLPSCSFFSTSEHLCQKLKSANGHYDIIHVHTEPDSLVVTARECCPDSTIIYDAHDLDSQRVGVPGPDECQAMEAADGVIFPSYLYCDGAKEVHPVLQRKPTTVIYSACSGDMFINSEAALPRLGGIVYEGGALACNETDPDELKDRVRYRDYRALSSRLAELNVPLTIFGVDVNHLHAYLSAGAFAVPSLPYMSMLRQLTRFDWGLVGCIPSHPQWEKAMPNKLFDYLAAGIPVIAINAGECGEFLRQHGFGVEVGTVEEIKSVYSSSETWAQCRKSVLRLRDDFAMEKFIRKLKNFYIAVKHELNIWRNL